MHLLGLNGKTVVVTGASSGIGHETALLLRAAGAEVIALDRNPASVAVSAFVKVDLSERESIEKAAQEIGARSIHGLCNIAGVPGTAPDIQVARTNYLGLRHLTRLMLPSIVSGGAVVNLASMAGFQWRERQELLNELAGIEPWTEAEAWIEKHPEMNEEPYRRYKEALIVWTLSVASKIFLKSGVRINCVSPGPVKTPILGDFRKSLGEKNVAEIIERTGRPAQPIEVAGAVLFLVSRLSERIVGTDLIVDSGLTASRFVSTMQATPA